MTTAAKTVQIAASQIGKMERPAGSNSTKYGRWYGMNGVAWCAIFVSWCLNEAKLNVNMNTKKGAHFCPHWVTWFKRHGQWHTNNPQAGDVVFFDWYPNTRKSGAWHVGIVESVNADGSIVTIEGNTSLTNQDNGGKVMRRTRAASLVHGYGRPKYANAEPVLSISPAEAEYNGFNGPAFIIGPSNSYFHEGYLRIKDLVKAGFDIKQDPKTKNFIIK